MIQVENLYKSFDHKPVLEGVSLTVERHEFVVVIGRSGYGKSVLLKHMAGMLRPDSGRVLVDGQDLSRINSRQLRSLRRRFGFVFQGGALFDSMSVADNVAFPLRESLSLDEPEVEERVAEVLRHVGLEGSEEKLPAHLSGGMIKRVALARALVMQPEIVFFDEPTTGLDPITAHAIIALIAECHHRFEFTGVIVSHQIPKIFEVVTRVALLHEGSIRFYGTPDESYASEDNVIQALLTGGDAGAHPSAPQPDGSQSRRQR